MNIIKQNQLIKNEFEKYLLKRNIDNLYIDFVSLENEKLILYCYIFFNSLRVGIYYEVIVQNDELITVIKEITDQTLNSSEHKQIEDLAKFVLNRLNEINEKEGLKLLRIKLVKAITNNGFEI